jgi:hypothetical protein
MASIAMVLLRFLRDRYEASALYAGRQQPRIVSASGDPVEEPDEVPPEDRKPPSEP